MDNTTRVVFGVVVGTVLVLILVAIMAMLLVVNANRRNRHRAELAELELERDREVIRAEREAIQQTLREVGRELHDNVGQLLTVVQLGLNSVLETPDRDPRLDAARDTLELGIAEVRRLGHDLNTDLWKSRSLIDAIRAEAYRLQRVTRLQVELSSDDGNVDLSADHKTILYRVFQEIINNTLKHGSAERVQIAYSYNGALSLRITDDGRGFHPGQVRANAGLENIRHRCALIGLTANCSSAPGSGCTWHIHGEPDDMAKGVKQ